MHSQGQREGVPDLRTSDAIEVLIRKSTVGWLVFLRVPGPSNCPSEKGEFGIPTMIPNLRLVVKENPTGTTMFLFFWGGVLKKDTNRFFHWGASFKDQTVGLQPETCENGALARDNMPRNRETQASSKTSRLPTNKRVKQRPDYGKIHRPSLPVTIQSGQPMAATYHYRRPNMFLLVFEGWST